MKYNEDLYAAGAQPLTRMLAPERPQTEQPARKIRVVVVDDHAPMRQMICHSLAASSDIDVVGVGGDGSAALRLVESLSPDVLLIDLVMPLMNGVEAIRALRTRGYTVPTLVLTSNADRASVTEAVEAGADGYVLKGAAASEVRSALREVASGGTVLAPAVARGVVQDYSRLLEEKRGRDLAVIRTLAGAVERRDRVTGDHIHNVSTMSSDLYRRITGSEPDEDMVYGFLLHDVGKISIPDDILLKKDVLSAQEYERMKTHVQIGVELIAPLGFSSIVTDIIACHHEKWDGSGYPRGLSGEQIPLYARLFTVVDAYDAMTADRPYRAGVSPEAAVQELERTSGAQFDPDCVVAFIGMLREHGAF